MSSVPVLEAPPSSMATLISVPLQVTCPFPCPFTFYCFPQRPGRPPLAPHTAGPGVLASSEFPQPGAWMAGLPLLQPRVSISKAGPRGWLSWDMGVSGRETARDNAEEAQGQTWLSGDPPLQPSSTPAPRPQGLGGAAPFLQCPPEPLLHLLRALAQVAFPCRCPHLVGHLPPLEVRAGMSSLLPPCGFRRPT